MNFHIKDEQRKVKSVHALKLTFGLPCWEQMLSQRHQGITFHAPIPLAARCSKMQHFTLAAGGFVVQLLAEIRFQRLL